MRTVGQILKETREAKFYTLEEVEKATKIRKELLMALESDDYAKLPPTTFLQGFIKNYSKFLKLDSEKMLAVFRREFSDKVHKPYVMDAFSNPMDKWKLNFTPGKVLGLVVGILVLSFFAYLWLQYRNLVGPPALNLGSPPDQYTSQTPQVIVQGTTDPETKVFINNQEVQTDPKGGFKEEVTLAGHLSKINVTVVSKFGRKTTIERTVYLNEG